MQRRENYLRCTYRDENFISIQNVSENSKVSFENQELSFKTTFSVIAKENFSYLK